MRKIGSNTRFFLQVNICFFLCICVFIFGSMLICVHFIGTPYPKRLTSYHGKGLCPTVLSQVTSPTLPLWGESHQLQ